MIFDQRDIDVLRLLCWCQYVRPNDLTSAKYISEKCGKVTISVTNNQMPLMPLFSPVYPSTRPYSQTQSSTQRDLMLPDEILRLDRKKCIALFQGRKPALLYKLAPEELPDYGTLKPCKVIDYIPAWRKREEQAKTEEKASTPQKMAKKTPPVHKEPEEEIQYRISDMNVSTSGELGMVEIDAVRGDEDMDSPPR